MRLHSLLAVLSMSLAAPAFAQSCPPNAHVDRVEESASSKHVHCKCNVGFENRNGVCAEVAMRQNGGKEQLARLKDRARSEWYWFALNNFDVMTAAFWAAVSGDGSGPPVDEAAREAKEHLAAYLETVRQIEEITHSRQVALERYQARLRNLAVARKGPYSVNPSRGSVSGVPSSDFESWAADDRARQGAKCIFDATGTLVCR